MARPTEKKNRWTAFRRVCSSTKKNRWTAPLDGGVALIDPKKKTLKTISTNSLSCQCLCAGAGRALVTLADEAYCTNPLVLAPHQKDEQEPRRVNNKHDEAYRVLPREMVRRP